MSRLNRLLNWNVRVCYLFGIPIHLHISLVFFLAAVFGRSSTDFGHGVEYAVAVVFCILLHELGHGLTAKHYKMSDLSIMLHGFGGFAVSRGYRSPTQALVITLAGPAVTFVVGIVCLLAGKWGVPRFEFGTETFEQFWLLYSLGVLNIWMGFLNLLPTFPLDGGHALKAILSYRNSDYRATRMTCQIGLLVSIATLGVALYLGDNFIGFFGFIGLVSSILTLVNAGGFNFRDMAAARRERKENEERRKREQARHEAYMDNVSARQREREEKDRLRKLFETSLKDD